MTPACLTIHKRTMRVALFHEPGRIAIEQVPDDPLLPTDVRIEIERCGICGSDVAMTSGSAFDFPHRPAASDTRAPAR